MRHTLYTDFNIDFFATWPSPAPRIVTHNDRLVSSFGFRDSKPLECASWHAIGTGCCEAQQEHHNFNHLDCTHRRRAVSPVNEPAGSKESSLSSRRTSGEYLSTMAVTLRHVVCLEVCPFRSSSSPQSGCAPEQALTKLFSLAGSELRVRRLDTACRPSA